MSLGVLRGLYKGITGVYETSSNGVEFDTNEIILPEGGERMPRPVSEWETDEAPWIVTAKGLYGTEEYSEGDNEVILQWARDLGGQVAKDYKHDSIAWCGLFVAYCVYVNGIEPVKDPLWALNWAKWQTKVEPSYGCIMAFRRNGGGHVGFYISEDANTFHILGGNQSDEVTLAKVSKDQFVSARWATDYMDIHKPGRIRKAFNGAALSSGQMS